MAKPKPKRPHGEPDLVKIQLSVSVRKPKGYKITRQLLDAVALQWQETGTVPKGFKVRHIRWENPGREEAEDRKPRYAFSKSEQAEAHRSLNIRRLLHTVRLKLEKVGAHR
jgi:hypothetical protein